MRFPRRRQLRIPAPPASSAAVALVLLAAALGGCLAEEALPATPAPTEPAVFQPVQFATPTATPPPPLSEDEIDDALRALACWYEDPNLARTCLPPGEEFLTTLQQVALSGDERFIAPLVDMLWLDIGWERWVREALERVSGERFSTAAEWYAWMTGNPPPVPDGYGEWKGRLLAVIDPAFTELIPEESALDGPGPEQLVWSLVRADAVPPLIEPEHIHRVEELYLANSDVVFAVAEDGVQRAYPERILGWHGSLADEISGTGILVWHCPSCGGAAVFGRAASDGQSYTFSASGLVWESRRLFRDEETNSLWDAVSGRAVAGPLAAAGVRLTPRPSVRTTWGEWSARYPNTQVLSLETGVIRNYDAGAYLVTVPETEDRPAFPVPQLDDRLAPLTPVFAVTVGGARRAYPLAAVEAAGLVRDTVGGSDIVIVSPGPGRGATAYETLGTVFTALSGPPADRVLTDADEVDWFLDDERLVNTRNSRVREVVPSQVAYWFAWSGAFPGTALWSP